MLTLKKSTALFVLLAVAGISSLLVVSCNPNTPPEKDKGTFIPVPKDSSALAKIDHFIPAATITEFRRAFLGDSISRDPNLFVTESEGFNKPALLELLKDSTCVGIRIYYGITKGNKGKELRMIIVGTDSQGKDLLITRGSAASGRVTANDGGLEYGQCCQGQPAK
jgi:hypothetical protein